MSHARRRITIPVNLFTELAQDNDVSIFCPFNSEWKDARKGDSVICVSALTPSSTITATIIEKIEERSFQKAVQYFHREQYLRSEEDIPQLVQELNTSHPHSEGRCLAIRLASIE